MSAGVHDPFDDDVLGRVRFHDGHNEWEFTVPIRGRDVRGKIVPPHPNAPLSDQGLDEIRSCVAWIRDNEPAIRDYITAQMFDGWRSAWYDKDIDTITTPEEFRDAISLPGFSVLEDRVATLFYDDGGLFGGHAIVLSVAPGGRFTQPPVIWG